METIVPALAERDLNVHVVCCARRDPDFHDVMRRYREANIRVTEISMTRGVSPLAAFAVIGLPLAVMALNLAVRRAKRDGSLGSF